LRKVLRDTKLQPGDICLEITESALIRQTEETLSRLAKLSAVGVQLALDDFGTGYSALSYLPRLPVSHLKLDRAFVADLDGDSAPIAAAVVGMARALGLGVIAEGVETERQALRLAELGYRLAQGYRYSKPLDDLARAVEVTRIPLTGIDGGLDG
jgi:EAL domain-containing protein (putative c-di-GMP-specific phosphodiesterase class I)